VTGLIKQTPNSIGLRGADLRGAEQHSLWRRQELLGEFCEGRPWRAVSAAAAGAAKEIPDDFRVSITNAPGKNAYPISSFTWLLIPQKFQDAGKREGGERLS